MKLLENSLHSILSLQQNIHSPHYTLWLPTVVFNGAPVIKNLKELSKIQRRAALWITGAFHTSPTEGVKAIAGLIPIFLYLRKLNGWPYLWYKSIPLSHTINLLLDIQYAKNQTPHKFLTHKLTTKQNTKLKSFIKDVNKWLSEVNESFFPFHSIFFPGLRVVNHFFNNFSFHSPILSDKEDIHKYLDHLNETF